MASRPSLAPPGHNPFFGHWPAPWADAAALVAGAATVLAFAPFGLFPLAALGPAVLFVLWSFSSALRAAWRGFLYGLGLFGAGVSWVYVSLHHYGNMPAPLAAVAVALFVAFLALYPALLGLLQALWVGRRDAWFLVAVLPALWVLFEWWRGWFLTGFPWLALGYSQADTWLAGYAPWVGVYGVSLACAVTAGLLAQCARAPRRCLSGWLPLVALVWAGGGLAGSIEWVRPQGAPLRAVLVQGNVSLAAKWHEAERSAILARYLALSRIGLGADLIVWPEAAIPAYLDEVGPDLETLQRLAAQYGSDFLVGAIERTADRRGYYNSAVLIGAAPGVYRKRHLVPFGEFLPLKRQLAWLLDFLHIPMSDFRAGPPGQPPLRAAGRPLGVTICYEDAFGEELIAALPQAVVLVNLSEDAWFGDSLAPHQRLQMARLRARETGRPMLRAANTGPSAAIDHRGALLARAPTFRPFALEVHVQPMTGVTPYARFGTLPLLLALAAVVLAGLIRRPPSD